MAWGLIYNLIINKAPDTIVERGMAVAEVRAALLQNDVPVPSSVSERLQQFSAGELNVT